MLLAVNETLLLGDYRSFHFFHRIIFVCDRLIAEGQHKLHNSQEWDQDCLGPHVGLMMSTFSLNARVRGCQKLQMTA